MSEPQKKQQKKKERTFLFTLARAFAHLMLLFYPTRYHGVENIPSEAPFILISNHKHWFDPLLIAVKVRPFETRFLGKKELGKEKIAHYVLQKLHMILVDRHNSDMAAMRACVNVIRQGHVLAVFPEGTRCKNTTMEHIESGAAFIALRCKVPLVPVLIERPCKLFCRNEVWFGKPLEVQDLYAEEMNTETVARLMDRMCSGIRALNAA